MRMHAQGQSLKSIMRTFADRDGNLLFSWTVVEREMRKAVEIDGASFSPSRKETIRSWSPLSFTLERTTVWDFPQRGDWGVHTGDYRGNWPPQVPRNLISRFTEEGDWVVDGFVGGGTTLYEAWLLDRRSVGLDVSSLAVSTIKSRLREMEDRSTECGGVALDPFKRPLVAHHSALDMCTFLESQGVGLGDVPLICAHPPYLDALRYCPGNPSDLSRLNDPETYCGEIRRFGVEAFRALRTGGICAVLIGDVRKANTLIPLGLYVLRAFQEVGFQVQDVVIKRQHKDRSSEFYAAKSAYMLMIAHEYLLVLRKPSPGCARESTQ